MKSSFKAIGLSIAALLGASALAAPAFAAPTIDVAPWLAPNVYGSPSWEQWRDNALEAAFQGDFEHGTPGTPFFAQANANITPGDITVSGFASRKGKADPGTEFGAAYANELGTRGHFGLRIDGMGDQFSISQLGFGANSDDPTQTLAFYYLPGSYNYNDRYKGVLKGSDGILWTADDTFITGGANNQFVDGLIGVGSGNAYAAYCVGCTIPQQQAALDDVTSWEDFPTKFWGEYYLFDSVNDKALATGRADFFISSPTAAIPEPASWAMMLSGFMVLGASVRRNKRLASVVA
ncbi:MAG: hypothetical protein A2808_03995 [Candidatus Moranbacteria bacterium RIFCSPHIGHO2_01_FULL_55_24]|nr:MAG: hypothetical protein A2808_03995 [Candidatus Moranbacteria bacterium RIFCSPHIGHO2_01_FULL_55_24]